MAYNTKLYKSTGNGWDEVRVGSEWGLIANKPSTFTPTAHSHPEYLSLAGGTLSGSLSITSANFPVLDITRNTGSSGSGVYGGARLRRVTSNPQAGVGIGFYFSAPNASGAEKFAGLFGACLTNIASGAEVGQLKFTPAWHGDDPYDNTVMTLTATGANQGNLALNGKIYSSPTSDSDSDDTVATKGYVDSKITMPLYTTTSSIYTSNANYHNAIVVIDSSSTRYVYIDSDTEGTYAPPGTQITVIRKGSGNVVISTSGGTYLAEGSKNYINERYQAVTLIKDSVANTWFVVGALR